MSMQKPRILRFCMDAQKLVRKLCRMPVDLLHDLRAAAHVGMIFQGETAVSCFQFVKGVDVGKVFHVCLPPRFYLSVGGC